MSQRAASRESGRGGAEDPHRGQATSPADRLEQRDGFQRWVREDREEAFAALLERYQDEIFDLCARVSGSRTEAEDLTQETFIRAYENLGAYRGEAAPRSWLYRIALNRSISFTRRLKRWRMTRGGEDEIFPELEELAVPSPEGQVERDDDVRAAQQAVQELPPRQRAAVVLRYAREMSYDQIAEAMGTSVGGAKANVHQGIARLRRILEE